MGELEEIGVKEIKKNQKDQLRLEKINPDQTILKSHKIE